MYRPPLTQVIIHVPTNIFTTFTICIIQSLHIYIYLHEQTSNHKNCIVLSQLILEGNLTSNLKIPQIRSPTTQKKSNKTTLFWMCVYYASRCNCLYLNTWYGSLYSNTWFGKNNVKIPGLKWDGFQDKIIFIYFIRLRIQQVCWFREGSLVGRG